LTIEKDISIVSIVNITIVIFTSGGDSMRTVVFASNKGGVGKTTLATIYAEAALHAGLEVCCVDLDVYQKNFQSNLGYYEENGGGSAAWSEKMPKDGWDLCVVDTPPSLGREALEAVRVADYVICPVTPNRNAIEGLRPILDQKEGNLRSVGVVLNMFKPQRLVSLWVHYMAWKGLIDLGVTIIADVRESAMIQNNIAFGYYWDKGLYPSMTGGYLAFINGATKGEDMSEEERREFNESNRPDIERAQRLFEDKEE
jgi:chromosome partitioning protein